MKKSTKKIAFIAIAAAIVAAVIYFFVKKGKNGAANAPVQQGMAPEADPDFCEKYKLGLINTLVAPNCPN